MSENSLSKIDDDRGLFLRMARGDEMAFTQIVRHYTHIVYPYLLQWLKSAHQAEELTQDVFIRLWEKREKLLNVENFGGYLYAIARNIANAALQKQLFEVQELDADKLYELLTPSIEVKELKLVLDQAIDALPPRRKEVFLLSRMENKTYEEIASQLNISRSAVRQHIVEALVFLRHYIKKHGGITVSILFFLSLTCPTF